MNIADFFHEDTIVHAKTLDAEMLRQYQRLSSRAQEEVQEFMQFKLQLEEKDRKTN
jgi:hypothetical protein